MQEDEAHFDSSRLVGCCSHLLAKELQSWGGDIPSKEVLVDC